MSTYALSYVHEAISHKSIVNPVTNEIIYDHGTQTWLDGIDRDEHIELISNSSSDRITVSWCYTSFAYLHRPDGSKCAYEGCNASNEHLAMFNLSDGGTMFLCREHVEYYHQRIGRIYKCSHCSGIYQYSARIEVSSSRIEVSSSVFMCPQCAESRRQTCQHCGSTFYLSAYNVDGECICEHCYHEHTLQCSLCGDRHFTSNLIESEYCTNCDNRGVTRCDDCGCLRYADGNDLCSDCRHRKYRIREYSYKPSPHFYGITTNKRYYGIELEVDKGNSSKRNETVREILQSNEEVYIKEDGSLSDGFEIVTHPCSLEYHLNILDWQGICKEAKQADYKSHDAGTCGLHVHVSKDSLSLGLWAKVALFWYTQGDFIKLICRRDPGHYCTDKSVNANNPDEKALLKNRSGRYDAVNFESNTYTVEFRQFKGTLNPDTIKATLLFLDSLFNFLSKKTLKDIGKNPAKILKAYETNLTKSSEYALLREYIKVRKITCQWQES